MTEGWAVRSELLVHLTVEAVVGYPILWHPGSRERQCPSSSLLSESSVYRMAPPTFAEGPPLMLSGNALREDADLLMVL